VNDNSRVAAGPRVFGGMPLPTEVIADEVRKRRVAKPLKIKRRNI
jgi:hypothetical protein